jgi:hypothetical protein
MRNVSYLHFVLHSFAVTIQMSNHLSLNRMIMDYSTYSTADHKEEVVSICVSSANDSYPPFEVPARKELGAPLQGLQIWGKCGKLSSYYSDNGNPKKVCLIFWLRCVYAMWNHV